ncbi:TraX family protein [Clostridium botulinum]|nr:TraX family protein [Clostridium botulinum]
MIFSIIQISLYNGKKGKSNKYLFYIYYPLHIYTLYLISYFIL